jgi:hypothetical protein
MILTQARHRAVFSKRVYDIQDAIRSSEYHLCFEVANLKTAFYKKNGFDGSPHIHRAERLAYVLKNKQVIVYHQDAGRQFHV